MPIDLIKKKKKKKDAVFTSNCSTAIFLLLKSLGLKNKKIIVPVNICFDVILSIIFSTNIPIIVDTNDKLSYDILEFKLSLQSNDKVGAVIFPYAFGNSHNFNDIFKICKKKKIILIEDIAGSFGGKIGASYFGSFADFTVGSFGQGKIIDMDGGGFIASNKISICNKVKSNYDLLKEHTIKNKNLYYKVNTIYYKILSNKKYKKLFNKNNLQIFFDAFIYKKNFDKKYFKILNSKIVKIDNINFIRNKKANYFEKILNFKKFVSIRHKKGSVYWRKNFLVKDLDSFKIINYLNLQNIYARKYYAPLNYIFPFFKKKFINYEKNYKHLINFWVGNETNFNEIKKIKKILGNIYNVN